MCGQQGRKVEAQASRKLLCAGFAFHKARSAGSARQLLVEVGMRNAASHPEELIDEMETLVLAEGARQLGSETLNIGRP